MSPNSRFCFQSTLLFEFVASLFSCSFLFLVLQSDALSQDMEYTDSIVAVVNDDVITTFDVASFNAEREKSIRAKYNGRDLNNFEVRNQLVEELNSNRIAATNELVNQNLIYAEFEKKGYQLPVGLIDKRIDSIVSSQANGDWKEFEEMLARSNTTMEDLRDRVQRNLAVELLMSQSIDKNINISPDQIEHYYHENLDEFTMPAKVRLQVVGMKRTVNETREEYNKRVHTVATVLKNGAEFAEVVKTYSDLPNKKNSGDLGWVLVSDVRREFKEGLKNIEKNEISEPVQLDNTTYFVHVSDLQPEIVRSPDEVFYSIKNRLFLLDKQRRYEEYIDEIRSKSYVRLFFEK